MVTQRLEENESTVGILVRCVKCVVIVQQVSYPQGLRTSDIYQEVHADGSTREVPRGVGESQDRCQNKRGRRRYAACTARCLAQSWCTEILSITNNLTSSS